MARDHALALTLPSRSAVIRVYRWERPTLSLGRNEPAVDVYDGEAARAAGIDVVRRPTGGRAVLHHRELTYGVVMPVRSHGGVREAYLALNRALRRGLASVGVPAEIAGESGTGRTPAPDAGPCFRAPAPGELVARGRKLVGSAQARMGRVLLQHGSILVEDDQDRLDRLVMPGRGTQEGGPSGPVTGPATLAEVLQGDVPDWKTLGDAVTGGIRAELGGRWEGSEPAIDPEVEARLLERYRSHTWTWRR